MKYIPCTTLYKGLNWTFTRQKPYFWKMEDEKQLLLQKCLRSIETKLGWGSAHNWTHQDFLNLSDRIQEETGEPLSYITLKRVWGKVAYNSFPNSNTLNTLVRFLGYESWRTYETKAQNETPARLPGFSWGRALALGALFIFVLLIVPGAKTKVRLDPADFAFSSRKVVSEGIPNTVVFDIEATQSPDDSVIVQQSWDRRRRTTISKYQSQHTSIYYFPGFFEAKLVVADQVVREHALHITTDGWYCAVQREAGPPVYFSLDEVSRDGRLELSSKQVRKRNITLQPEPPLTRIGNVREFGGLTMDNFVFEAVFRNTYAEGSAACQHTRVYLLGQGGVTWVDFSVPGCTSALSLNFADHHADGKRVDLSAFGVDFTDFANLRIEVVDGEGKVFLNDLLVYQVPGLIRAVPIKGIDFRFEGLGAVERATLSHPDQKSLVLSDSFGD